MKFLTALLLSLFFAGAALSCVEEGKGFLPENDLYIPENSKFLGGLTEAQFHQVITKVETIYAPIIRNLGGNLKIARKWKDGTVNASATRIFGWNVNMYGGLARHPAITEDGFALVLCHEIGHHIGGAPKVGGLMYWASNEGQSDYFATTKCLRRTFLNDNNIEIVKKMSVPKALEEGCSKAWSGAEDRALCIRNGMAGLSVSSLFAAMSELPEPKFETPSTWNTPRTDNTHPGYQCRLDTYFQGALCEASVNEDFSQKEPVRGSCHGSLGHTVGLRPRCWYKP